MPKRDGTGPPKTAKGPKDGRGQGKGNNVNDKGQGAMTGGKKGLKNGRKS